MVGSSHGRARAIQVGLEEIDQHLGEYQEREQWRDMLGGLIDRHGDLEDQSHGQIIDLTVDRFEEFLRRFASDHPRPGHPKNPSQVVFAEGSATIDTVYLEKLEYHAPVTNTSAGDGEDSAAPKAEVADAELEEIAQERSLQRPMSRTTASAKDPSVEPSGSSAAFNPDDHDSDEDDKDLKRRRHKRQRTTVKFVPGAEAALEQATVRQKADPKPAATHESERRAPVAVTSAQIRTQTNGSTQPQGSPEVDKPNTALAVQDKAASSGSHGVKATAAIEVEDAKVEAVRSMSTDTVDLVPIFTAEVEGAMQNLGVSIASTTQNMLEGVPNTRAGWVTDPHPELLSVFRLLFKADYQGRIIDIHGSKPITCTQSLEACLAAAIFEFIFRKEVPWDGPKEKLAKLGDVTGMDRVLQDIGCDRTLEYVIWQAARIEYGEDSFKSAVQDEASRLSRIILLALDQQLDRLGASTHGYTADVARLVFKALMLKVKLRAAPWYYEIKWINSGTRLRREMMNEVNKSKGEQEVMWCISPVVRYRRTQAEDWKVAALARVVTRPWSDKSS
ncbi:hypothetical protein LTR53_004667 [Teratosphaeriaceae sp. CCFEE 6253]|nr:hypothetical protein LTR53_004667 [Teratosphaeriaceae sp. CCFEE 6253]